LSAKRSIVSARIGSEPQYATRHELKSKAAACSSDIRLVHSSNPYVGPPLAVAFQWAIASSHVSGRCRNVSGDIKTDRPPLKTGCST
jgi:hypothetical protein